MDILNYGDKVTCLRKLKIKGKEYAPGDNLPYEREGINFWLIQTLCKQKRLILSSELSPERLEQLKQPKVPKIIKNYNGLRIAVSWPPNEPLPDGVILAEPSVKNPTTPQKENDEFEQEVEAEETEEEVEIETSEEVEEDGEEEETIEVELLHLGGGYYDVMADGKPINDRKLRKKEARQLMEDYINS